MELSKPYDLVQGPHPWCLHMCNWACRFEVRQRSPRFTYLMCVANEMLPPIVVLLEIVQLKIVDIFLSHDLIVGCKRWYAYGPKISTSPFTILI